MEVAEGVAEAARPGPPLIFMIVPQGEPLAVGQNRYRR